ncbi:hypothetical protein HYDPIDRAFT_119368 [Hydnomerulius pinastri MD-312]|uniref:ABC transporter domain-containing protein n=1 Tax=Hydnomerulius pinastri MD-312 TaxID=994086 RepID=A0A0C9W728_9AGAM|nr:hypothetical protein HYDPIDRAFT_119368 [Hydnomerulius pinastri MD-312]
MISKRRGSSGSTIELDDDLSSDDDIMDPCQPEAPPRIEDIVFPFLSDGAKKLKTRLESLSEGLGGVDTCEFRLLAKEIDGLANRIPTSRRVAVIGRSGSGKSTALNALLGCKLLMSASSGCC